MENYPSNSQTRKAAAKQEPPQKEKKVEKIVVGEVTRRKKPLGRRFTETFIRGDAESVWMYVASDVLIPAAKDMIADAVSQGIEKMLYGETRGRSRSSRAGIGKSTGTYTSYNRFSVNPGHRPDPREAQISRRARATHNFDEIILATRHEADEVLDNLFSLVDDYDVATVADLYDMVGQSSAYTDEKWGWTDIRGANVTRIKGGYLLNLPRPNHID